MSIAIPNQEGEQLAADINIVQEDMCVVLCHGFGGHRKTGVPASLYELFVHENISVCRFDFSGSGESEGDFSKGTFTKATRDVQNVVSYLCETHGFSHIVLVGHSMGGSACLYSAQDDTRISAVIALAAPIQGKEVMKQNESWLFAGNRLAPPNIPTAPTREYVITQEWIDDAANHNLSFLRAGLLVLGMYGARDEVVSVHNAALLAKLGGRIVALDTNHSFSGVREQVFGEIVSFLKENQLKTFKTS